MKYYEDKSDRKMELKLLSFDKNIDWYMDNWKDNFSDYINDLMRIAVSDIERKKLTDIYEKMRKIMKESSKKRG